MSLRLLPAVLLALMAVQACDGTPFGQQLSDSFDGSSSESASGNPQPSVQSRAESVRSVKEEPVEPVSVEEEPVEQASVEEVSVGDDSGKQDSVKAEAAESKTMKTGTRPLPSKTRRRLPYRITLRLFSADPAAPAEGVTEALRKAGIGFEVETIEKSSTAQPSALTDDRPTSSP